MPSQRRSAAPLRSANGVPLRWAIRPGAWLAIRMRAPAPICTIGRGPSGSSGAQRRHARTSARSAASLDEGLILEPRHQLVARFDLVLGAGRLEPARVQVEVADREGRAAIEA